MTVASEQSRNDFIGTGTTATFNYGFRVTQDSDLLVIQKNLGASEVVLFPVTNFTVTGLNQSAGGTITLVAGNLPLGAILLIRRKLEIKQEGDIISQGKFVRKLHEDLYDISRFIDQQQQNDLDRTLKVVETEIPSDLVTLLPGLTARKGLLLKFNAVTGAPEGAAQSVVPVELIWEVRGLSSLADNPFTRYRVKKPISFKGFDVNGLVAGTGGNQILLFKRFPGGSTVATVTLADGVREAETLTNASFVAGEEIAPEWSTIAPTTPLEDVQLRARV